VRKIFQVYDRAQCRNLVYTMKNRGYHKRRKGGGETNWSTFSFLSTVSGYYWYTSLVLFVGRVELKQVIWNLRKAGKYVSFCSVQLQFVFLVVDL
jgi:hypothetical protein